LHATLGSRTLASLNLVYDLPHDDLALVPTSFLHVVNHGIDSRSIFRRRNLLRVVIVIFTNPGFIDRDVITTCGLQQDNGIFTGGRRGKQPISLEGIGIHIRRMTRELNSSTAALKRSFLLSTNFFIAAGVKAGGGAKENLVRGLSYISHMERKSRVTQKTQPSYL
jgi:hypothetical protein